MATQKQELVFRALSENIRKQKPEPLGTLILRAGYSPTVALKPKLVTASKGFQELLDEAMPDDELMEVHKGLLRTKKLDHMVFPLGPENDDDPNMSGSQPNALNPTDGLPNSNPRTTLTDKEITAMLAEVGGTVRRIVHGETARHVYFWVANDKARQDALKLAYDLKGKLNNKDPASNEGATYNAFITGNTINPNAPTAKELAEATLDIMMERTKRKVVDV